MWFLEKVSIICLAQFTMLPCRQSKPHTFLNNSPIKMNNQYTSKNYLASMQTETDIKNSDTNSESILKAFNFRDIEYPVATTPRPQHFYFQDFDDNPSPLRNFMPDANNLKISSDLKPARYGALNNLQKFVKSTIKSNANKPKGLSVLPKKITPGADFKNVGSFPEVEYPLSAKEIWKPNYWSVPFALIADDSQCNQNLTNTNPTRNLGINKYSEKSRSFSIKSYSDIIKNKKLLKQILETKANNTTNKQNNSTCRNDAIVDCEKIFPTNDVKILPIEETVQELRTTSMPYFTTIDPSLNCEEFNINFSNITSLFNKSNQYNNYSSISFQNALIPKKLKTDNLFIDDNTLNFEEISAILLDSSGQKHNIQEINYDPYDIIDVRKPETGSNLYGLDDDYTTGIYSEEKNIGWFSHPVSTPSPFSATTVDLTWKNCKTITPSEFIVDDLEDYYISV